MLSLQAFFRRNAVLMWVVGLTVVGVFAFIQVNKAISSPIVNYGKASSCRYYLVPSDHKEPLTRKDTLGQSCPS